MTVTIVTKQTRNNLLVMDTICIEDIGAYSRDGRLEQYLPVLLEKIKKYEYYEKNTVYSLDIFIAHLNRVEYVQYLDELTSTVDRCVEYGLKSQLVLLLSNLERLISICLCDDGVICLDRRLLLRKADIECYLLAKEAGFVDGELEKRITRMQEIWRHRNTSIKDISLKGFEYSGPTPQEYWGITKITGDILEETRYWGYRHTMYLLRWNPTKRYKILKLIRGVWFGNCRYQAYVDYLEKETEDVIVPPPGILASL